MCFFNAPAPAPQKEVAAIIPPSKSDPEAAQAGDDRRRRAAKSKGRKSTVLTSASGDTKAANIGRRTLG